MLAKPVLKKAQAAMEYLTTYGWAIIAVAVVLVALYALGVLNANGLAPRAQPGSCQVYKQTGLPSTLGGQCSSGILPQFVAQFNGQNGYIQAKLPTTVVTGTTISVWFDNFNPPDTGVAVLIGNANGYGIVVPGGCSSSTVGAVEQGAFWVCPNYPISYSVWYNAVLVSTASGTSNVIYSLYLNGNNVYTSPSYGYPPTPQYSMLIGSGAAPPNPSYLSPIQLFNGLLSNVQIYNATLPASDITSLYQEGIGGAPIDLNYLIGWWPLNGNGNDYSGNSDTGTATSVTYTSQWTSGYSAP